MDEIPWDALTPVPQVPRRFAYLFSLDKHLQGARKVARWRAPPGPRNLAAIRKYSSLLFPQGFGGEDKRYALETLGKDHVDKPVYRLVAQGAQEQARGIEELPCEEFMRLARAWNRAHPILPPNPVYVGVRMRQPAYMSDVVQEWTGTYLLVLLNPLRARDYTKDKPLEPWCSAGSFTIPTPQTANLRLPGTEGLQEQRTRRQYLVTWRLKLEALERTLYRHVERLNQEARARDWYAEHPVPFLVFTPAGGSTFRQYWQRLTGWDLQAQETDAAVLRTEPS